MTTTAFMSPEWVIIGIARPDGRVGVFASTTMTHAQLTAQIERDPPPRSWVPREYSVIRGYSLSGFMSTFVYVEADSYAEALRTLLNDWSPDVAAREIGSGSTLNVVSKQ